MTARILVIEDNSANLELMRYLLDASGYVTLTARDGGEGLDLVRAERPDLIVCDTQMPKRDGFDVARELKQDPGLRSIPLVAVTAAAMVGDRERVLAAGFDGYISKPIDPESFAQQVAAFLAPELRRVALPRPETVIAEPDMVQPTGQTILVLDNLQVNLDLYTDIFISSGHRVIAARVAEEALRLARQAPPDLILSDVCMPNGSGFDFIKEIKVDPKLRAIPFVFCTSTATNESDRRNGLALGAAKFLFRPMDPKDLLREIEACLGTVGGG